MTAPLKHNQPMRLLLCKLLAVLFASLNGQDTQNVDPRKGRVTTNPTSGNRYSIEQEIELGHQAAAEIEKKLALNSRTLTPKTSTPNLAFRILIHVRRDRLACPEAFVNAKLERMDVSTAPYAEASEPEGAAVVQRFSKHVHCVLTAALAEAASASFEETEFAAGALLGVYDQVDAVNLKIHLTV